MFGRPSLDQQRSRRQAEREANLRSLATPSRTLRRAAIARCDVAAKPIEKEHPARSEAYRRLVAAMPCAMCAMGPCQAAHANQGKGMALKTDDRTCFALCVSCHRAFDQGGGMSRKDRRVLEDLFGRRTRLVITNAGTWPKNLPAWPEEA